MCLLVSNGVPRRAVQCDVKTLRLAAGSEGLQAAGTALHTALALILPVTCFMFTARSEPREPEESQKSQKGKKGGYLQKRC
jgi:hypothetical protein